MGLTGLIIGILSILGMTIAFIPLLGWLNWFNIPFAFIGLAFGISGVAKSRGFRHGLGVTGTVLCGFAITIGAIRLSIGGGIL